MGEVLSAANLSKRFGAVQALDEVSFALPQGEIRALCGENGAGKSTFVKLLIGLHQPDAGVIRVAGQEVAILGPRHAERLGIGIVAQELSLAPHLSILDNIWLGSAETPFLYRRDELRRRASEAMAALGAGDWDLDRHVGELTLGERQIVEIARLLARRAKIMILDEPTATLSDAEIGRLIGVLRGLKARGHSIVYISHRLGEIFEVCDGVSVFRNGRHVATRAVADVTREELIELMLGRAVGEVYPETSDAAAGGGVRIAGLRIPGAVRGVSLEASRGRITCIAGQVGSGATTIARALAGLVPNATGEVTLDGRPVVLGSVPAALDRNILFVSDDRAAEGIFAELTVVDNLLASRLGNGARLGFLSWRRLRREAVRLAEMAQIDRRRLRARAGELSGGNQQKVLFGRALERGAAGVLVMNEPTRGIDVGARADIYRLMRRFCEAGNALVMTSSDLEEVVGMADVVFTIYRGRNVARYEGQGIEMARILADITHPAVGALAS